MGSKLGILKIAAKRTGLSLEEYEAKTSSGLKYCWKCLSWKLIKFFGIDNSRYDKRTSICYACKNKTGKPRNALTDIKRQARNAVNCAVRDGILPSIKTLKCLLCSNKAVEYHHHINYEKENWIQVQPLCKICHIKIHK